MFVERFKKKRVIQSTESHRPVNFICKKSSSIFIQHFYCLRWKKKKDFIYCLSLSYWTPIKYYSIIKVDPCGEVSWNWVLRCFSCFFSAETTITTHSRRHPNRTPPPAPPCVIYPSIHTSVLFIHSSTALSFLPLSPSLHP